MAQAKDAPSSRAIPALVHNLLSRLGAGHCHGNGLFDISNRPVTWQATAPEGNPSELVNITNKTWPAGRVLSRLVREIFILLQHFQQYPLEPPLRLAKRLEPPDLREVWPCWPCTFRDVCLLPKSCSKPVSHRVKRKETWTHSLDRLGTNGRGHF